MSATTPSPAAAPPSALRGTAPHRFGPALALLVVAVALWLIFSVSLGEIVRYIAYEAAFVAVPGVLAYMALAGSARLGLRELALGWPLGYALELAAFALTAAIGERGLFWLYPPLVIALAGAVLLARRRRPAEAESGTPASERGERLWGWGLAVLVGLLFVYAAEGYFAPNPLPTDLSGPVSYAQDYVWQVSLAAEALNHWPVSLPNAAGLDLHYHYFAYLHMAAVSQVTGLDLGLVNFRLWLLPILVLVPLQLVAMGRALGAGSWAGIAAGALVLLVGAFDPWPRPPSEFFTSAYQSGSYGFGLIFFLPLALLIGEQLRAPGRGDARGWVLVAVFGAAASGSKSTILPVCFIALALAGVAALWLERGRRLLERDLLGRVVVAGGIIGLCALVARLVLYPGSDQSLQVRPLREVARLNPAAWINAELGLTGIPKAVVVGLSAVLETGKLLAPLAVGLWALVRLRGRRLGVAELWLLALLAAGLLSYYTLFHPNDSDLYFLYYGYVAGGVAAGAGLVLLARRYLPDVRPSALTVSVAAAIGLAVWATDGPPGAYVGANTPPAFYGHLRGEVTWSQDNSNLTPALYAGMRWIADNTPKDAVLAVNNRWQDAAGVDPRYCYWTAFAERRVLLECEYGTELTGEFAPFSALQANPATAGGALPERARLEHELFYAPDALARGAAALAARRYGVSYAALDLVHPLGAAPRKATRLGDVVYRNDALIVVRLNAPPSP